MGRFLKNTSHHTTNTEKDLRTKGSVPKSLGKNMGQQLSNFKGGNMFSDKKHSEWHNP